MRQFLKSLSETSNTARRARAVLRRFMLPLVFSFVVLSIQTSTNPASLSRAFFYLSHKSVSQAFPPDPKQLAHTTTHSFQAKGRTTRDIDVVRREKRCFFFSMSSLPVASCTMKLALLPGVLANAVEATVDFVLCFAPYQD